MNEKTAISWTNATWNCLRGCQLASPGCKNCYAKRIAATFEARLKAQSPNANNPFKLFAYMEDGEARWTGKVSPLPDKLRDPLKLKEPSRIFTASMSDMFHPDVPWPFLDQMHAVMHLTPQHTYQNLTKRHEVMRDYYADPETPYRIGDSIEQLLHGAARPLLAGATAIPWPLPNAWSGVSVENNFWARRRVPVLRETPAAFRFLSCEPLLGPIKDLDLTGIHWVIVGGESGPGYRPMKMEWARAIRDRCVEKKVAFFFKQDAAPNTEMRPWLEEEDGSCWEWHQFPDAMTPPRQVFPPARRKPKTLLTKQKEQTT